MYAILNRSRGFEGVGRLLSAGGLTRQLCRGSRSASSSSSSASSSSSSSSSSRQRSVSPPARRLSLVNRPQTRSSSQISFYDQSVSHYAQLPTEKRSLKDMMEATRGEMTPARLIEDAVYVHTELPKRLSRRLEDLLSLPHIMVTNPHIEHVYEIYADSFRSLLATPRPATLSDQEAFVKILRKLVSNTVNVVEILAAGVNECLSKMERSPQRFANFDMDSFVDAMLSSRIGRRVLAEQHIALHEGPMKGHVGVINTRLRPAAVLEDCVREATDVCFRTYGEAPEVRWTGDVDAEIPYIRFHLQYVLHELLKNSMRATVEYHRAKERGGAGGPMGGRSPLLPTTSLPPIEVLIVRGEKDLTLRISDRGGGIPYDLIGNVFKYGFTTAKGSVGGIETDSAMGLGAVFASAQEASRPMAGLGFGAPLSRLYLQYFGGRLDLVSIEGYGTDCHVVLDAVGEHVEHVEV